MRAGALASWMRKFKPMAGCWWPPIPNSSSKPKMTANGSRLWPSLASVRRCFPPRADAPEKGAGDRASERSELRQLVQVRVGQKDQEYSSQYTTDGQEPPAGLHRQQGQRAV